MESMLPGFDAVALRTLGAHQGGAPVGTPSHSDHRGNSAPAHAPVAGLGKSERIGERGGLW